ncbi:2-amino-4-hydroxy-6-hydroxymethyldihydropteridine diphosphokinase [Prosthecochloris sp. SCSIO W1103]|uniref:2-amino-4-hydroxy-6- hydroxymethyldihydropteridine diphosphokinase n=1 Tax=Prosthecochloris sp. SCSIO W1103 TaxID=2992244 RepID=UPI00223CD06C|nr:2-amino-4-hydroxy-6-hydroxymethyldihydropteridine diphosphokinase [Prosthecochloris sp. SCSIO W1103]UZJ37989.1 2-amino-4-hydroxy-6-hydroxymethyldihydropteridine diphosphokinase [Prosthecochloris sp. SCSIO W1103]
MEQIQEKHTAFIGVGSNIGDRAANLQRALDMLEELPQTSIGKISRIYHSEPFGSIEQEWFYNAVFQLLTTLSPHALLSFCKKIESHMGRPAEHLKWGPRIIDLDILLYDDATYDRETLTIPHPEISNRKFVLLPLLDIDNPLHPVFGKTMAELLEACPDNSTIEPCGHMLRKHHGSTR